MTRKIDHERPKNPNRIYYRFWKHMVWNDDTTPLVPVYCNIVDGCDPTVAVGDFEYCTGLKDKNGSLIYEGDVVDDSLYKNNFVVSWDNDRTGYFLSANNTNHIDYLSKILIERHNLKIIGNVHQTKEKNIRVAQRTNTTMEQDT